MNQLNIVNHNGILLADSREVAVMTEKRHSDLLRDIEGYKVVLDQNANLRSDEFFIESTYEAGTGKQYKHFLLTRMGCDMVANKMTGAKGILFTATYVKQFNEMEQRAATQNKPSYMIEDGVERAKRWIEEEETRKAVENKALTLEQKVNEDRPKVVFAEALEASRDSILIGQLATILKQNGINIGQNRLFAYLRENGYICKHGDRYNLPTQKSMNLGVLETKVRIIGDGDDVKRRETTKVPSKGQKYFINKFKKEGA